MEEAMKKIVLIFLTVVIMGIESITALADDNISSVIVFKNNYFFLDKGEKISTQDINLYLSNDKIGGGVDVSMVRKNDFFKIEPFLTLNFKPWYFLGGFSVYSDGTRYVQAGFWYIKAFKEVSVCLDVRNFFRVDGKNSSYFDPFLNLTYPVGKKFYIGADVEYTHFWETPGDYYMLGPLIGYNISDDISLYVRFSQEWNLVNGVCDRSQRIRLGLKFSF